MTLVSAALVSEICVYCFNESNYREESAGIRLTPYWQFLAKTQRLDKVWNPMYSKIWQIEGNGAHAWTCKVVIFVWQRDSTKKYRNNGRSVKNLNETCVSTLLRVICG